MWRVLPAALVLACAAEDLARNLPQRNVTPPQADVTPPQGDVGTFSDLMTEAPAPAPECTALVTASPTPVDCSGTHGLMWCAGKGTNGCVPCPAEVGDGGGLVRRLDCDHDPTNGCETVEGTEHCGGCEVACGAGQRCITTWPAAPQAYAPHCE
jgi:hypothetical protein